MVGMFLTDGIKCELTGSLLGSLRTEGLRGSTCWKPLYSGDEWRLLSDSTDCLAPVPNTHGSPRGSRPTHGGWARIGPGEGVGDRGQEECISFSINNSPPMILVHCLGDPYFFLVLYVLCVGSKDQTHDFRRTCFGVIMLITMPALQYNIFTFLYIPL